jgi:hypothetical protein
MISGVLVGVRESPGNLTTLSSLLYEVADSLLASYIPLGGPAHRYVVLLLQVDIWCVIPGSGCFLTYWQQTLACYPLTEVA